MGRFRFRQKERGLGVLEAALIMMILLTIFLSAVGIFDYLSKGSLVSHVIDQFVHDQEVKPFEIQGATLRFAEDRLRQTLPIIVGNIETNLLAIFAREGIDATAYIIEAEFVAIEIDTQSGEPQRVARYRDSKVTRGSLTVPNEMTDRLSFDSEYEAMLDRGGSQYASPSGLYGLDSMQERYLPLTPIIAVRAAVSLEGSFTGSVLSTLGVSDPPIVYDLKAITLRGEVG